MTLSAPVMRMSSDRLCKSLAAGIRVANADEGAVLAWSKVETLRT